MLFLDITNCFTLMTANQKRWTLTTANRMLRNCQEDNRFCYDIRGKSCDKYDPCYAIPFFCSSLGSNGEDQLEKLAELERLLAQAQADKVHLVEEQVRKLINKGQSGGGGVYR